MINYSNEASLFYNYARKLIVQKQDNSDDGKYFRISLFLIWNKDLVVENLPGNNQKNWQWNSWYMSNPLLKTRWYACYAVSDVAVQCALVVYWNDRRKSTLWWKYKSRSVVNYLDAIWQDFLVCQLVHQLDSSMNDRWHNNIIIYHIEHYK